MGYEKYGGMRFLEMSCVLDVLAYLRVLSNAYDEIAWYRVLKIYEGVGQKYSQVISGGATSKGSHLLITLIRKENLQKLSKNFMKHTTNG